MTASYHADGTNAIGEPRNGPRRRAPVRHTLSVTTWHVRAVRLPDGDAPEDAWLTDAGWQDEPVDAAVDLPGRFALTGLVDAHSHVSFGAGDGGPIPLDRAAAEAALERLASDGVAVVRDAGGDPAVVLALPTVPGRPFVVAAGRHLAPAGMYFEAVHLPVAPADLVEVALTELAAGARWVKLVADFTPARARGAFSLEPPEQTYDLEVVADLVTETHRSGGRVAAHVTTALVGDLVRLGIDSVEHGTGLDEETLAEMAQRGTAWTPTLGAVLSNPPDAPAERRNLTAERRERFGQLLPLAVRLGVPVLTGGDAVGTIPREVALLVECGLDPTDALRAATVSALTFLGTDAADAPPSVVTYDQDPRDDPEVLARPAAIVVGGVRIR
jgi:imidazolonepropionase-like amidohydrolase